MIEVLKNIKINEMLSIDDESALSITNREDFNIIDKKEFQSEDGDCIILEMDDFFLIAHNLAGDVLYYLTELEKIEESHNSSVPDEILISKNNYDICYIISSEEWQFDSSTICEYENNEEKMSVIILEKTPTNDIIYRGFALDEESIVI